MTEITEIRFETHCCFLQSPS